VFIQTFPALSDVLLQLFETGSATRIPRGTRGIFQGIRKGLAKVRISASCLLLVFAMVPQSKEFKNTTNTINVFILFVVSLKFLLCATTLGDYTGETLSSLRPVEFTKTGEGIFCEVSTCVESEELS